MRIIDVLKCCLSGCITLYQKIISPYLLPACRHLPSCSVYAKEALATRGFCVAILLVVRRLARCRPGGSYGFDPVPRRS